jgi:DNA invertase Pin-like site-specific DNA recombinase
MSRTAREYARVSKGKGRTARSITDQHTDNLIAEQQHGPWAWGAPYADTGSASKYARKGRDDFDRLMSDLETGAFGNPGDVLVLWEISRLSRETGKGVALIDLCEAGGFLIHITSHGEDYGRTYDPRNYSDRHALISGINDAEKEARLLSARTLRGVNSAALEGRPHGVIPFGYKRDYELADGRPRPVAQYPDPSEGPLVLELFTRVAGTDDKLPEPIYSVAKDWEARVVVSRDGVPFSAQTLRSMLIRPAYAGLRKNNGQLIPVEWPGWTSIVSRALFDRVQALLADPTRRTYTADGIKHVFTTTIKCDVCCGPLIVRYSRGEVPGYECQGRGCVRINKAEVDEILISEIVAALSRPEIYQALNRNDGDGEEARSLRTELAGKRSALTVLEDAPKPKTPRAMLARTTDMEELETEIAELEARVQSLSRPSPLVELWGAYDPQEDVAARWAATDVTVRRAVAAQLLTPALLGEYRITRTPQPGVLSPAADRMVRYTAA